MIDQVDRFWLATRVLSNTRNGEIGFWLVFVHLGSPCLVICACKAAGMA